MQRLEFRGAASHMYDIRRQRVKVDPIEEFMEM
jgi:hypothetical protein